jgi:hypothetical protein
MLMALALLATPLLLLLTPVADLDWSEDMP